MVRGQRTYTHTCLANIICLGKLPKDILVQLYTYAVDIGCISLTDYNGMQWITWHSYKTIATGSAKMNPSAGCNEVPLPSTYHIIEDDT